MGTLRITLVEIDKIVSKVSNSYLRRFPALDRDDLMQQGRLTALRAVESFDPTKGEPTPYIKRAVNFAIRRMVWHDLAPVSGGGHIPEAFRGLRRVTIADEDPVRGTHLASRSSPAREAESNEWCARVRARVAALDESNVAACVIDDVPVGRVAEDQKVTAFTIYGRVRKLRAKMRADEELLSLAREG